MSEIVFSTSRNLLNIYKGQKATISMVKLLLEIVETSIKSISMTLSIEMVVS